MLILASPGRVKKTSVALQLSGYNILQEETDNQAYPDIPGYKILSELGRGGIATVYLAMQESLDRQVALKVMSPMLAMEPDYAERFITEGRTVAQLNHPNIITVYDIGLQKHQLFIAMEYISGGNMRTVMQEHNHDPEWALSIAGQIALALGYAHKVGIVHRDVKPENILFRENGAAVLTDFGIAKAITSSTNLTRAGTIIGTPKYMSPEQTDGMGNDPRTDIYSLGIILYEMLTGNVPYDSENSMAVLYAHVHSPIPELPEGLSDLQPLLNNLLAKKAEERSDDCDELAEIIRITRRERHYALKDPARMQEASLNRELQKTAQSKASFEQEEKKPDNDRKRIKYLAIALVCAIVVIAVVVIWRNDSNNVTGETENRQLNGNSTAGIEQKSNGPEQATTLSVPGTSILTEKPPIASSEIDDEDPVATEAEKNAEDSDAEEENQTQRLISRFLADEHNDELVKGQQAASPSSKEDSNKSFSLLNRQEKITHLLTRAREAIQEGHITVPSDDNAVTYYRQVLELSPHNRRALRGLDVSGDLIYKKAKEKYKAGNQDLALRQVDKALILIPDHAKLISLKNTIEASFNPNSSFAKAEKLYRGVDGPQDRSRAAFYYLKAAELGHIQAMNNTGVAYADGDGNQRSDRLAMKWFEKSARLGNSEAMYNLALGYHFSDVRDAPKALSWVKQAAKKEYRPAYMLIGWMTTTGTGTRASRVNSIRWDLKGMVNPISSELHSQYRIPKNWQEDFMVEYRKATNTGQ